MLGEIATMLQNCVTLNFTTLEILQVVSKKLNFTKGVVFVHRREAHVACIYSSYTVCCNHLGGTQRIRR